MQLDTMARRGLVGAAFVGDLGKIEAPVRALKLGDVQVIDADGKAVR